MLNECHNRDNKKYNNLQIYLMSVYSILEMSYNC